MCSSPCECGMSIHHIENDIDEPHRKSYMTALKQSLLEDKILAKPNANLLSTVEVIVALSQPDSTLQDSQILVLYINIVL